MNSPFGYRAILRHDIREPFTRPRRELVPHLWEQAIIRRILRMRAEGYTVKHTAAVLRLQGVMGRGGLLSAVTVQRLRKDSGAPPAPRRSLRKTQRGGYDGRYTLGNARLG